MAGSDEGDRRQIPKKYSHIKNGALGIRRWDGHFSTASRAAPAGLLLSAAPKDFPLTCRATGSTKTGEFSPNKLGEPDS